MFMHGSWEHLIGNMLFLWVFGNNIEDSMGHLRFIVFYLTCGAAAALAHIYLSPRARSPPSARAARSAGSWARTSCSTRRSGLHLVPADLLLPVRAVFLLGYWFLIQLAMGVITLGPEMGEQGGVAVWAHVGGFVAGLALIKIFEKPQLTDGEAEQDQALPGGGSAAGVVRGKM
jgi:membrane associated rhomboid family serine protease